MSATLKTENYGLPIYSNEDHTDWIDFNSAMEKIDGDMKSISNSGESTAITVEENTNAITAMQKTISDMQASDLGVANRVSANENAIANLTQDVNVLEQEFPVLKADVDAATDSVNGLDTRVENNEHAITGHTNRLNTLTTEVNALDTRVESLEDGTGGASFTCLADVSNGMTISYDGVIKSDLLASGTAYYTTAGFMYGGEIIVTTAGNNTVTGANSRISLSHESLFPNTFKGALKYKNGTSPSGVAHIIMNGKVLGIVNTMIFNVSPSNGYYIELSTVNIPTLNPGDSYMLRFNTTNGMNLAYGDYDIINKDV